MRTLLLVTLYLSLTNVGSMRRIEIRASCKKKQPSIRFSHSLCYLPVEVKNKKRSSLQIPPCNQETALKVLQFYSSWCFFFFGCKAEVIDITMGMLCCLARQAQSDVVLIYWFFWHFPHTSHTRPTCEKISDAPSSYSLLVQTLTKQLQPPPALQLVGWCHCGDLEQVPFSDWLDEFIITKQKWCP